MKFSASSDGMGIRGRLALLTGALALAIILIGGSALLAMGRLHAASQSLATEWMPRIALSNDVTSALASLRSAQYAHIMAFSREEKELLEKSMGTLIARIDGLRRQLAETATSDAERATLRDLERDWTGYQTKHQEIMAVSREGENETAASLMQADQRAAAANAVGTRTLDAATLFRQLTDEVATLTRLHREGGEQARLDAATTYERMLRGLLVALVLTIGLSVGVAVWIARGITRPVISAMRVLRRVAEGDLTEASRADASGELRQLLASLDETRQGLSQVVSTVREGTAAVALSSSELARGNLDLSNRTERQSANLQTTASAISQLSDTLRQNAEASHTATTLASSARGAAEAGGAEVGRLVVTMSEIAARSNDIVDIVTVMDGIAFQTNILALNASVEAARAGDQGRGFSVVASEVRQLALRSADAARQVRSLITSSVERIEAGATLAGHARRTVDGIVSQIREVSDTVARISSANDAQADGIGRIHASIAQMNGITQENAALVEQGAAAAELLRQQAGRLQSSVAVFRIA